VGNLYFLCNGSEPLKAGGMSNLIRLGHILTEFEFSRQFCPAEFSHSFRLFWSSSKYLKIYGAEAIFMFFHLLLRRGICLTQGHGGTSI
jgi:hypothetical protein